MGDGWIEVDGLRYGPNMVRHLRTERDELKRRVEAYVSLDIFNTLRRHGLYDSPAYREIAERYERVLSSTSPTEAGARKGHQTFPMDDAGELDDRAPPTTETTNHEAKETTMQATEEHLPDCNWEHGDWCNCANASTTEEKVYQAVCRNRWCHKYFYEGPDKPPVLCPECAESLDVMSAPPQHRRMERRDERRNQSPPDVRARAHPATSSKPRGCSR